MLLWTAVLLFSILLQYVVAASPPPALALNPSLFELDGNVTKETFTDWNTIRSGGGSPFASVFIDDPVNGNGDKYFDGGNTKDTIDIPSWAWTTVSQPQDKNDIENAYAAAYKDDGHLIVFFGLDRYASNGDAQVGFWFLQNEFGLTGGPATGGFAGSHKEGDVLVQIDFQNGGANPVLRVYTWTGGALALTDTGGSCAPDPSGMTRCGIASTADTDPNWPFDDKFAAGTDNLIPAGGMVEGGIDLTALGLDKGCFASFVAETRSSQSPTSTLSDFANGSFALCSKPDIKTFAQQDGKNLSSADTIGRINMGESVTDHAVLTGDSGTVTGSVKFFVCRDADALPDCSTGGTQVGGTVQLQGGEADSASFTPDQLGRYCFRVEYTPDAGSKYLADSHTNKTTECFRVIPADVRITKTAGQASVSAGSPITFTVAWGNVGEGKATGVVISDDLPGTAGLDWSIQSSTGTGSTCAITGPVGSEVLTCNVGAIDGNTTASGSVTLVSGTTAASCGTIDNTGSITSANDGSGSSSASTQVLCPDIKVTKTPDDGSISAGDTATFTIKVENLGPGTATGVVLTDTLPAGLSWTEDEADCSISGGVLTCDVGTLADGASKTYTFSAPTTKDNCGVIDNTAQATATNEPSGKLDNNSDSGKITVKCAVIEIVKDADHDVVNAGEAIGFTVTVKNTGTGNAYNVTASDTLDPAFTWSFDGSAGWSLVGNQLAYATATLAPGASSSVHVTAPTTAEDCRVVPNTATASSGNDGSDSDSAQVTIQCPDVTVTKTAVASPVNAGDPIAFDITVRNAGPGAAKGVTLTDKLPAGITWNEDSDACSITAGVLTCDFGDLAAEATATVRVSGTTSAAVCGTVVNTATVVATNEPDGVLGNNSSTDDVVVNCPDVTVTKTADNSPISAGDTASYTITVTNLGPGTAYGVTLSDPLPGGVTWTDDSADCTVTSGTLSCSFGSLAAGAVRTIHISGTTSAAVCGQLPNTATVAATNEAQAAQGNNQSSASITVQCPDIKVTKDADNSPISAGEVASFTIKVENIGTGTAYGVTLTDTLPANVTWTENSDACSITDGVLSCDFGTILPGPDMSRTVVVSGETTAVNCGSLPNTASASATNEPGTLLGNNSDSATVVVDCPQIVITKSTVTPEVSASESISFDVVVTNTGAGSAFGVTVSDPLPVVTDVSWSIDAANTTGSWTIDEGVLTFGPATLPAGASVKVRIISDTTADSCGEIPNVANLTYQGGSGSDDSSLVVLCPDVTISKTAANSPINAGDTASYTISVWNEGPGTAYDVEISDTLPAGVAWTENSDACSITGGVLTCQVGDLADNAAPFTVVVSGPTDAADCGPLPNLGKVSASNEPEANTGNNEDDATVVVDCAKIDVAKTADAASVSAGDSIGFTITVTNTGAGTAYDVTASDTLDAAFTWSIAAPSTGWTLVGNQLSYAAATLAPGASSSVHVTAPTTAEQCKVVPNSVTASAGNDGSDTATAQTEVLCPDVSVVKTAVASPVNAGDSIAFDITVRNAGPGIARDVTLTDKLPAGITWNEDSESCSITGGVLSCAFGDLADDATVKVRVSGTTSAAVCGTVVNTATVAASNERDGVLGNNSSTDDVVVNCPDVTVTKTADNSPILAGQTASFTITASNAGPGAAYDVVISDTLPAGLSWTEASESCSITGGVLTCQVGTLAPKADFKVTVSATTTVAACGQLPNTAMVSASNESAAAAEAGNTSSASITVQCASISLVKTAGDAADDAELLLTKPGNVTFTYVVTNTGTADLENLELVDDNATPANTADDITIADCEPDSLRLVAGTFMTCTATLPATSGLRINIATVTANPVLEPEGEVSATDDAVVRVPEPAVTPRPTPKITPPPTSALDSETPTSAGNGLLLVLLSLAGSMLAIGYLVPSPARARRRNRRG